MIWFALAGLLIVLLIILIIAVKASGEMAETIDEWREE